MTDPKFHDGFAAALETAKSVCVLVEGLDHVSKADVIMRLEEALEKLKTHSFPLIEGKSE
jgi:hypothetical protein